MVTTPEIVDTALKVGLGAIISGGSTLLVAWFNHKQTSEVAKLNHDRTTEKERANRRVNLVESIAEQVARFDQVASFHWAFIADWIKIKMPKEEMTEEDKAEMIRLRREVKEAFKELVSAKSKLLLIGEVDSLNLLNQYIGCVEFFGHESIIRGECSLEGITKYSKNLLNKSEAFFNELSKAYSKY